MNKKPLVFDCLSPAFCTCDNCTDDTPEPVIILDDDINDYLDEETD